MATKSLGRVSIVPQGDYDENQAYKRLDLVKDGGKTYLSLKEDNTSLLADEDSWMLLTESGRFEDLTPQELETLLQPLNEATEAANEATEAANTAAQNALLGIKDEATTATVPSATEFERYIVHESGTYTNFLSGGSPIEVTSADLDVVNGVANNRVILEVSEGVATKRVERVKGDDGPQGEDLTYLFDSIAVDTSIYDVNPDIEMVASSTFSAWGQEIGVLNNFNKVKFKTRAYSAGDEPTTVKIVIHGLPLGTIIYENTKTVDFSVDKTQTLEWSFPNIANIANESISISFYSNGYISLFATAGGSFPVYYATAKDATYLVSATAGNNQMNLKVSREETQLVLKEEALPAPEPVVTPTQVEVILPDKFQAIVGDKLQLFTRGMIKAVNPYNYDVKITCPLGQQYPRYYELTPVAGNVGNHDLLIEVKDSLGNVIHSKNCTLEIKSAGVSPVSQTTVLAIGDSLTAGGDWVIEAARRLTQSGGSPAGNSLSNIQFKGRKTNGVIGWEGTGGWSWDSYTAVGATAYRFAVSGVTTPPQLGSVYTNNGQSFIIDEINITAGSGNIRGAFSGGAPSASGVLTKSSGGGDATITFSASAAESGNPFHNGTDVSFTNYVNAYLGGDLDVVAFLMSWNGLTPHMTDFSGIKGSIRYIIDRLHAEYPSAKVKLMGIQIPSINGGMGANYGAIGSYADDYGMIVTALNQNKAYQELANEAAYSSWVEFVNVSAQFDSENNMPEQDVYVNTRSTKTEKRGTNGVHPTIEGYYQIADAFYRNFVARFCQ